MTKKHCIKCGKTISAKDAFCEHCGERVIKDGVSKVLKNKKMLYIGAAVIIVVFIAFMVTRAGSKIGLEDIEVPATPLESPGNVNEEFSSWAGTINYNAAKIVCNREGEFIASDSAIACNIPGKDFGCNAPGDMQKIRDFCEDYLGAEFVCEIGSLTCTYDATTPTPPTETPPQPTEQDTAKLKCEGFCASWTAAGGPTIASGGYWDARLCAERTDLDLNSDGFNTIADGYSCRGSTNPLLSYSECPLNC